MLNNRRARSVCRGPITPVRWRLRCHGTGTRRFEPQRVKKRQRCLTDVDEIVLSLYAKDLTTGEISAHFADIYGASVGKDTVSKITDRVIEEMQACWQRPLERVYTAVFIDAIMVRIRDGQVRNRPVYAAIGVDLEGHEDILACGPVMETASRPSSGWRVQEPRCPGCVLRRLRRPQEPARQCQHRVPRWRRADLHHPPDPQQLPVYVPKVLGQGQLRPETVLHRAHGLSGPSATVPTGRLSDEVARSFSWCGLAGWRSRLPVHVDHARQAARVVLELLGPGWIIQLRKARSPHCRDARFKAPCRVGQSRPGRQPDRLPRLVHRAGREAPPAPCCRVRVSTPVSSGCRRRHRKACGSLWAGG